MGTPKRAHFSTMPVSDQGVNLERYMLIPRVLILLTHRDRFLLLKGAPDKRLWAGRYNGLGGHVEAGESLLAAAQRELLEESGLQAELRLCGSLLVDTGENPGVGVFIFTGECDCPDLKASTEGSLYWLSAGEIADLPVVEDLPFLLERIRSRQPGDAPFSARSFYDPQGHLQVEFA